MNENLLAALGDFTQAVASGEDFDKSQLHRRVVPVMAPPCYALQVWWLDEFENGKLFTAFVDELGNRIGGDSRFTEFRFDDLERGLVRPMYIKRESK